jgi:hypothetical protein|nr:MAG TPA: hypothetical protein [Caudoviricetes sp.]
MDYVVVRRIAEMFNMSIEEAYKIAPKLQNEIFLNNIITASMVILIIVLFSSFLLALVIDEYEKAFKPAVWAFRISAILIVIVLISWQFLVPTLTLLQKLK